MKRLRHPVRAIREPFGTAGLVVACIAIVLALTGAAFAAGKLTSKQKKEVEKIAKKFAGKPGAPGAAGPAGPQGPAGTNGKDGAQGEKGAKGDTGSPGSPGAPGSPGSPGAAGASVQEVESGASVCGGKGGTIYEIEGSGVENEVCDGENGEKGEKGDEGSPWTDGGTLPPGAVETGVWSYVGSNTANPQGFSIPLSFPIPLGSSLQEENVHIFGEFNFGATCGGATTPEPQPEQLCVYGISGIGGSHPRGIFKQVEEEERGATRFGAALEFSAPTESIARGNGVFAVAGPAPAP